MIQEAEPSSLDVWATTACWATPDLTNEGNLGYVLFFMVSVFY
mgnify:CR=1 FL=1